jgi:hypothetical protein
MFNKLIISTLTLLVLFLIANSAVFAGGCCFESVSVLSSGTAGETVALIEGKLLSKNFVMTGQEPRYQANQAIQVMNQNSPSVKCKSATTDSSGHFTIECLSSKAGSFNVEVKPVASNDSAGQATPVTIVFNPGSKTIPDPTSAPTTTPTPKTTPKATVSPVASSTPTASPSSTPMPSTTSDVAMQQKVAELEAKVQQQEEKITFLESVVKNLQEWVGNLFKF